MPGAGGRHIDLGCADGTRTQCHHRPARRACPGCQRQRHRADQSGNPAPIAGSASRLALHRARQANTHNAFIESFNGRLRDELLNETLFASLADARVALRDWMKDYNTVRPHSAIGNVPPMIYAMLSDPAMQRDGSLRSWASAPRPVAPPSQQGSNDGRALLPTG